LAFDDPVFYEAGGIIVSFLEEVGVEEARTILSQDNLFILEEEVCFTQQSSPEETGESFCEIKERWDDALKSAWVVVPEGTEKAYAKSLIGEEKIIWVEPNMLEGVSNDGWSFMNSPEKDQNNFLGYYLVGGIILALIIFLVLFLNLKKKE